MSLVADYGSSDESQEGSSGNMNAPIDTNNSDTSDDDDSSSKDGTQAVSFTISSNTKLPTLPSAKDILESGTLGIGVLKNPFKVAEDRKIASLEKHVKMVDTDANVLMKNGKKICWNYRKGRCRFGSACNFAHDSDVTQTTAEGEQKSSTSSGEKTENNHLGAIKKTIKKRPGLSDTLVPGKKVLKMYSNFKKS